MPNMNFNFNKILFFVLFISQFSFAQLAGFTLNVTPQNETCSGNGTLTFSVSGITSGATIIYQIYKLPNTTTPIASTATTTLTGLNNGNYQVVANQTLGALSNTQTQNVSIANEIVSLVYTVSATQESCNNGSIEVNVTQGNPVLYKLKLGAVIVASQSSNVFNNLVAGAYTVSVVDVCGEELPLSYTLTKVDYYKILPFEKPCVLNSCTTVSGTIEIEALTGMNLIYPFTVEFTLTPQGGGTPTVQTQIITSGGLLSQTISFTVPYQLGQNNYSVKVTDACLIVKTLNANFVMQPSLNLDNSNSCVKSFSAAICDIMPPYTLNFLAAPAGFNPTNFNSTHPGPFNVASTSYTSTPTNILPNGNYDLQVTDACGRITHNQITIIDINPSYQIAPTGIPCSNFSAVNCFDFDLTSVIITTSTSGFPTPLPFDASGNINSNGDFSVNLPPGTYTIEATNACGTFTNQVVVPIRQTQILVNGSVTSGCSNGQILVRSIGANLQTITIISGPPAFTVPFDATSFINPTNLGEALLLNLPAGNYVLSVIDSCGNLQTPFNATVSTNLSVLPPVTTIANGCVEGFASLKIQSLNGALQIVRITSAPAAFSQILPYDVSFNIATDGAFYMNSFPIGAYTFYTKDACTIENTQTIQVTSYAFDSNSIIVQPNCGSFNVVMNYTQPINTNSHTFWLQKWNVTLNQWEHPFTNALYTNGSLPDTTNSFQLNNNTSNLNINVQGTFRILKSFDIYSNGSDVLEKCFNVAKTFDFNDRLSILSAYAIPCASGNGTEVILSAQGIPPYTYKITQKNGQPFVVNNGSSNVFSGLQSGVYNFEVSDVCGAIVNRDFDITSLPLPTVAPNNLCSGQNGSLSVEPFSFFNYQWWKDNNTATILSTTNVLNFNPFNNTTDSGIYHVRIYSPNSISCTDRILDYTIPINNAPNAGQDVNRVLCGSQNQVDLFTFLGTHDANGTWQEVVSNSGTLSNNIWISSGLPLGTYQFKYTVNGFCGATDDATVSITLNPTTQAPVASVDTIICETQSLNLYATTIANATYQWSGPNGFSSTDQNPIINTITTAVNGTYSVKTIIGTCESSIATVEVLVTKTPIFTLSNSCQGSSYIILAQPINNSFDVNDVVYNWIGPNGYLNISNPAIIPNGATGNYQLEITNTNGCKFSDVFNVLNTSCDIPNVITPNNDEFNNSFDLTGLEVQNFQVFNRWGALVYELDNYVNEWHGQNNQNQNLPNATYYYIINFANGESKKGWIMLEGI